MNEMTRKILLGGFILTALVLIAGAAAAENGWIHGTVSDTYLVPKGKSISGANVSVENGGWSVITNNTGYFNLSLPVGSYTLRATKSGYNDNVSGIVTVSGNATFTQNFILVKPNGNLKGSVMDTNDGTPIAHVVIYIYFGGVLQDQYDTTDTNGKYDITGISVGTVTVHLSTFWVYGTGNNDANYTITIQNGQTTTKDFQLPPIPIDVNVTVKDANGNGIFGATIKLGSQLNRVISQDGKAILMIAPGNYTLEVSADGYETVSKSVTVKRNNPGFEVVLKKPGTPINGIGDSGTGTLAIGVLALILIPVIIIVIVIVIVFMMRKKKKATTVQAQMPLPQLAPWEPPRI